MPGAGVLEGADESGGGLVVLPDLDGDGALGHGRQHDVGGEPVGDPVLLPQADHAGGGENDGVVLPVIELADAGGHVAAQVGDLEVGP